VRSGTSSGRRSAVGGRRSAVGGRRGTFDRPFQVIGADRFVRGLVQHIADERIRALPLTGAIDQFADNTDFLGRGEFTRDIIRTILRD
jgi:hypothetical protein